MLDGVESMRFKVRHLSLFGVYGTGAADAAEELLEINVETRSLSAPPVPEESVSAVKYMPKFVVAGAMLLTGLIIIASAGRSRKVKESRSERQNPQGSIRKQDKETRQKERCIRK